MNTKNKNTYDDTSISSLKGEDRVRKRPSVIFGSDGLEGCKHAFFEILSNSIDEVREGHGTEINVIRHSDNSITVEDFGRGIPLGYNKAEKRYNWELIFCELYAGGKYDNNTGGDYEYSLGLNGLGACASQYASRWFKVEVRRDSKLYTLEFEKGVNIGGLKEQDIDSKKTGTLQRWLPDLDVFTDIKIPLEHFQDVLKKQAVVNKNVKFNLYDERTDTSFVYFYENGIMDYISELSANKNISSIGYYTDNSEGRDRPDKPLYKVKAEFAFCFNNEINACEYYHNSSFLEYGGAPDKAVKSAFVGEVDTFIKTLSKYQKGEKKVSFTDIEDSLIVIVNSFSTITSYENQTKKAITNKFIQSFLTEFIRANLEVYFIENRTQAEKIIDQILANKRARERAEKTRQIVRKQLSSKIDISNRIKKFVDCRTKKVEERELYIVEGDSALGACKQARDANFQALIPVRGKILNCLKADEIRIFKSDIITDLINVLGCGVELKSKHMKGAAKFNIDRLNWGKVIICTDADVDGFQIRTLILTVFYRLMPSLIRENKIFIAETPLFEISTKDDIYFAYNELEKNNILEKIGEKSFKIQRSKGLGENEPEMMWTTTMSPETRRLVSLSCDNEIETRNTFDILLGEDLDGRKKYIEENGHLYMEHLDIS